MAGVTRLRAERGQAGAEYVAILLVVGAVLAGAAGVAAAVPGVGDRVTATVRTGICIVGGDLCRTADAAAAGLPPCLTRERGDRQDTTLDVAVVRIGGHGEWQLALRSDGSAVVTRLEANEAGGTVGVGVSFSPAGIEAGASATLTAGYRSGRAWRFPDAAAARAFLDAARHDAGVSAGRPPDERWDALAGTGDARAEAAIADRRAWGSARAVRRCSACGVRATPARSRSTSAATRRRSRSYSPASRRRPGRGAAWWPS